MVFAVVFLSSSVFAAVSREIRFVVGVDYWEENESMSLVDVFLAEGRASNSREISPRFAANLYAFNESLLYSVEFDVSTVVFDAADRSWFDKDGNQIFVPTARAIAPQGYGFEFISLPYFNEAKKVAIIKNSNRNVLLEVDLANFTNCNQNGACDYLQGENTKNCGTDCKDPSQDLPIVPVEKPAIPLIVPIIAVLLMAIAVAYLYKKNRASESKLL